jgi:hypothetical protein
MNSNEKSYSDSELALSDKVTSAVSSAYLRNLFERTGKLEAVTPIKGVNNEIHHNYFWSGTHNNSKHHARKPDANARLGEGFFEA